MGAQVRVLGPVEVVTDDGPTAISGNKRTRLLSVLASSVGRTVTTGELIDALWGRDADRERDHALQAQVSRLRQALEPLGGGVIVTDDGGYRLDIEPTRVDAVRFEQLVERARQQLAEDTPEAAAGSLRQADELWRGRPFGAQADGPVLATETARLEELRRAAGDLRADAAIASGRHEELIPELEQRVDADPLREGAWQRLMLARYLAGRQAEALSAYEELSALLREELGIDPSPAAQRLHRRILQQHETLHPQTAPTATDPAATEATVHLPTPISSFVGREELLAKAGDLLDSGRLVTCVGHGGAGKTRLAIEIARANLDRWPGGAWFVDLAPLEVGQLVGETIAATLDVLGQSNRPAIEMAAEALRGRRALLVLDNCEHVHESAAAAARRLLSACEDLQILATSRTPLGVAGEQRHHVAPLAVPPRGARPDLAALREFGAVQLFVERAEQTDSSFVLTGEAAEHVTAICRRLDGIPLAIELAAARVRALPVATLAEQLPAGEAVLAGSAAGAPPRQRTLEASIAWSHDLLDRPHQRLLERLSVFAGSFTLTAAEAVAGSDGDDSRRKRDVVAGVGDLVDSSLLLRDGDDGRRYRMLETVRAFGRERLGHRGVRDRVRDRHLQWAVQRARQVQAGLDGPEQVAWLGRLRHELDDLRAAMDWAADNGRKPEGLAIAAGLYRYWFMRGLREGRRWLDRLLALDGHVPDRVLAAASYADGALRLFLGEEGADPAVARSRRLFEQLGAARGAAHAGNALIRARWGTVPPDELRDLVDTVLDEFRTAGDTHGIAYTTIFVALWEVEYGDGEKALAAAEELLELADQLGAPQLLAHANEAMTYSWYAADRSPSAKITDHTSRALQLYAQIHNERCGAHGLTAAGLWLAHCGRSRPTAVLQGAAEAARRRLGAHAPRYEHPYGFDVLERVTDLPGDAWAHHVEEGRRLTFLEAVDYGREMLADTAGR